MGPSVELLTAPEQEPCVMRGTIPPDVAIGLHAHAEPETFIGISGELEGLVDGSWRRVGPVTSCTSPATPRTPGTTARPSRRSP